MKKRVISLLLTGCLVLGGLTGCGSKEEPATANNNTPEETKQTVEEKAPEVIPENLTEVQKIIKEAESMTMEELAKNRTTFVIAHRLSTIRNAKRILVLTENGIEEEGTHEALLAKNGAYAALYQLQFR